MRFPKRVCIYRVAPRSKSLSRIFIKSN